MYIFYDPEKIHYLVKWKNYPISSNTWEPFEHLKKAKDKIREWKTNKKEIREEVKGKF